MGRPEIEQQGAEAACRATLSYRLTTTQPILSKKAYHSLVYESDCPNKKASA